eukprot:6079087-Pyramimonas_sp.AAC.2
MPDILRRWGPAPLGPPRGWARPDLLGPPRVRARRFCCVSLVMYTWLGIVPNDHGHLQPKRLLTSRALDTREL